MGRYEGERERESIPLEKRPLLEPISRNYFVLESHEQTVVGEPQIVTRVGDDIIVSHPSPELLGYSRIVVTKNNPVPVLVN